MKAKQKELIELQGKKTASSFLPQIEKRVTDAKWVARATIVKNNIPSVLRSLTEAAKEASEELTTKVKDGFASASESVKGGLATASETIKSGVASATETVNDLKDRGTEYFKGDASDTGTETRTQKEIAEEALTHKETGTVKSPVDALSATEIKTGAVAY